MIDPVFFVRHGAYERAHGELTSLGIEQAETARMTLNMNGVGDEAIVLASDAPRAHQTAEIIVAGTQRTLLSSTAIKKAGNAAEGVEDLDAYLGETLAEHGVNADQMTEQLVVVTHAPLVALVCGLTTRHADRIPYGEVAPYQPGTWQNPEYSDVNRQILELGL